MIGQVNPKKFREKATSVHFNNHKSHMTLLDKNNMKNLKKHVSEENY
jgi:hypothetical protein